MGGVLHGAESETGGGESKRSRERRKEEKAGGKQGNGVRIDDYTIAYIHASNSTCDMTFQTLITVSWQCADYSEPSVWDHMKAKRPIEGARMPLIRANLLCRAERKSHQQRLPP